MTSGAPSPALLALTQAGAAFLLQIGAGVALLVGAALLWRAIFARRALAPPRCARCGHDLRTFAEPPTHCVECGSDLARDAAMAFDRRVGSRGKAIVGVALCLLAGVGWLEAQRRIRLGRLAPAAPSWAGGLFTAAPPTPPPSLDDLTQSESSPDDRIWTALRGVLRDPAFDRSQLDAIIAALADRGGAGALRLDMDERWDLDDAGWAMLALASPTQQRALAEAWVGPLVVHAPERVLPWSPIAIRVQADELSPAQRLVRTPAGLSQPAGPIVAAMQVLDIRVDGRARDVRARDARGALSSEGVATFDVMAPAQSGVFEIEIDVLRSLFRRDEMPYFGLGDDPETWPRPLVEQRLTIRRPIEVVPTGATLLSRANDPKVREIVRGSLVVRQATLERQGDARQLLVEVGIAAPDQGPRITGRTAPFAIAGRVRVRLGKRWCDGPLLLVWSTGNGLGQRGGGRFAIPLGGEEDPTTIDVRIDPVDDDPSLRPPDDRPIWGEAIELSGVPVEQDAR